MLHNRPYQQDMENGVFETWGKGARVTVMQAPTGAGKTQVIQSIANKVPGAGVIMAHRAELVGQVSLALNKAGLAHNIMAPSATRNVIVKKHLERHKRTTYSKNARWTVASVDTLNARGKMAEYQPWINSIENVFGDEGHHVLRLNKWGRAFALFTNMKRGLLPTATVNRPDGKGLGSWADGIADALVIGPPMRDLINDGYLCDYQVHAVRPSDLDLTGVPIDEATGDYNQAALAEAVKASKTIIGDIVETYIEHAWGERGITFAVDIEHAHKIADRFNQRGVRAIAISSKSTNDERTTAMEQFEAGTVWQLVNVDLFGEGTDIPDVRCISMGRPTASYVIYAQEFGRVLRLLLTELQHEMWDTFSVQMRKEIIARSGKPFGKVFDHVANIYRHEGPPDKPRPISLDSRSRRKWKLGDAIPMTGCLKCFKPYERFYSKCPYCGATPAAPAARGSADEVDGNIYLLTEDEIAKMRGEMKHIDGAPKLPYGKPELNSLVTRNHNERQKQQRLLRDTIDVWAGTYTEVSNETNYKRFYFLFGTDVMSACTLGAGDAEKLRVRIVVQMAKRGIVFN